MKHVEDEAYFFLTCAVGKSYILPRLLLCLFKIVPGRLPVSIPFFFSPLWPSETSHNLLHHCHADGVITSKRSASSPPPFWATLRVTCGWTHNPFPIRINTEIRVALPVCLNPSVAPLEYWFTHAGRLGEERGGGDFSTWIRLLMIKRSTYQVDWFHYPWNDANWNFE